MYLQHKQALTGHLSWWGLGFSVSYASTCHISDCVCFWCRSGEDSETGSGGAHLCHALQLRPCQLVHHPAETHTRTPNERLLFLPGENTKVCCDAEDCCCYLNNHTYYIKCVFIQLASDFSEQFWFPTFFFFFFLLLGNAYLEKKVEI